MPGFVNEQQPGFRAPWGGGDQVGARLLVVSGGRMGVGATTVAIEVARELAQDALRTVLIDADTARPTIATRCGLAAGMNIGDVLAGRKTIHEALQRGPAGMQVLAGDVTNQAKAPLDERSNGRLLKQLHSLAPHADWLVVDAGNQVSELMARLWSHADELFLVTAVDAVAVMDAYALLKTVHSRAALRQAPALVVNQVADDGVAIDVHRRIDQSCRRFLGLSVTYAGVLRSDVAHPLSEDRASLADSVTQLCKHLLDPRRSVTKSPRAA